MRQTLPISKLHSNDLDFCHLLKLKVHSQATLLGTPGRHGGSSKKARRHRDMVTMLKPSIRKGKKGDLSDLIDFECDIAVGADRLSFLRICWSIGIFLYKRLYVYREWSRIKENTQWKYPVKLFKAFLLSSLGENTVLMSKVKWEWQDCIELMLRQQQLK